MLEIFIHFGESRLGNGAYASVFLVQFHSVLAFICHNSSGFGKAKIVFFGLKFGHGCVLPVFSRGRGFRPCGLVMAVVSVWCGMATKRAARCCGCASALRHDRRRD